MKKNYKSNPGQKSLKRIGKNIERLMHEAGYRSGYDFWIHCAGDYMSRDTIARLLRGEDSRLSTILTIAKLLKVSPSKILDIH